MQRFAITSIYTAVIKITPNFSRQNQLQMIEFGIELGIILKKCLIIILTRSIETTKKEDGNNGKKK